MKRLAAAGLFYLIICISAYPQTKGITQCEGDMTHVPMVAEPGGVNVVEQIPCNQVVILIGLEKGFFKIDLIDRAPYVYAKYIKLMENQEHSTFANPGEPEDVMPQSAETGLPDAYATVAKGDSKLFPIQHCAAAGRTWERSCSSVYNN